MRPKYLGFCGFLVGALYQTVVVLLSKYSTIESVNLSAIHSLPPGHHKILFFTWQALVPFLINPTFLFLVFYRIGRTVDLRETYILVVANVFVGGLVGMSLPFFLLEPALFGFQWAVVFPDAFTSVTTIVGLLFLVVDFGLSVLFPALSAIALANYRRKAK